MNSEELKFRERRLVMAKRKNKKARDITMRICDAIEESLNTPHILYYTEDSGLFGDIDKMEPSSMV